MFFGGSEPAFVDIFAFETLSLATEWEPSIAANTPTLNRLVEAVRARPNLKAYFDNGRQ